VFLLYIIPDLVAKIPDDKNDLINSSFLYLINDNAKHRLSCKWNQRFWLGVSVWTQLCACASNWDYGLHVDFRACENSELLINKNLFTASDSI
jgi:hypothetical protein